jgi:6-phosphogluconolactonase
MEVRVYPGEEWAEGSAAFIGEALPERGNVVLTGGNSAANVYPALAARRDRWDELEVFFSDDRAVPPTAPDSNYRLALTTLLSRVSAGPVHRVRGEIAPDDAAEDYSRHVAGREMDLMILGLGAEGHVAALFPKSDALREERLCVAVDRPDGKIGITLTPPILVAAHAVVFIVMGSSKAEAVERMVRGEESPHTCPARIFASHPDVVLLLDDDAAAAL